MPHQHRTISKISFWDTALEVWIARLTRVAHLILSRGRPRFLDKTRDDPRCSPEQRTDIHVTVRVTADMRPEDHTNAKGIVGQHENVILDRADETAMLPRGLLDLFPTSFKQ